MLNLYKWKAVFSLAFMFLFFSFSYSQDNLLLDKYHIWIKGNNDTKEIFNNNPVVELDEDLSFTNKLAKKSTFFFVYKNDSVNSSNIARLKYGNHNVEITTEGLVKNGKKVVEVKNKPHGQIVTYSFHDPRVNLSSKNEIIIYKPKAMDNNFQFLEIIVVPERLSNREIRKIETYLAIKFGISLTQEQDYLGRHNDTIWNVSKSEKFTNRVTGIGFNIDNGTNQKYSGNSQGDGLVIGFSNDQNKSNSTIEYLLWGDDNGTVKIDGDQKGSNFTERSWKYAYTIVNDEVSVESPSVDISFDLSSSNLKSLQGNEKLYLALSDRIEAFDVDNLDAIELHEPSQKDSLFINFKGIKLQKNGYFKLLKIDDLNMKFTEAIVCNSSSEFTFDISGGVEPYRIQLINLETNAEENYSVTDKVFTKTFENFGDFEVVVKDKFNQLISDVINVKDSQIKVDILSQIEINKDEYRMLSPTITSTTDLSNLNYKWYFEEHLIAETKDVIVAEEGTYNLNISSESFNCDFPVIVEYKKIDTTTSSEINLTPNPINAGENLNINFSFNNAQNLKITLFDVNGKLIHNENLQNVKTSTFRKQIVNSGIYFINVEYSQQTQTFKLIVK